MSAPIAWFMQPSAAPARSRSRSRLLVETLEPRILYSADLAAVVGAVGTGGAEAGLMQELRLQTSATAMATTATATAAEIAFVDLGIPDAGTLLSSLLAQRAQGRLIEVVTFTGEEDGLARISLTLAERQAEGARFDAMHVFSHGSAGALQLGSTTLDADSLLRRAGEIAGWGTALGVQADLMLYGCDVADGAEGLFLIEGLSALTGADVAASDDATGSAALGGDWLLEQHTGHIEAEVAVDAAVQATWAGLLGNEIQVNTTTAGTQTTDAETRGSQQAVAMDASGNYTVVWTSSGQDGGGNGVYARRFAFDGTALSGEIQVNTTTADDQHNARIVGDSAGNFAVVWSSSNQDGTASSVYFRRFAADGTALTGEIRANETATGAQSNAVIGMNTSNGDVVVAWQGDGPGTGSVYFRRFAADGTTLDVTDRAVSVTGGEANPVVAMDSTGRVVVGWDRSNHMYFQRYDAAGLAAGSQSQVDNGFSKSIGSTIAMDEAGNFALAYREQNTLTGIWGKAYNADGSARGTWFYADTGDAISPSISLAADGSAVVVYQKAGDGDGTGIYARKLNASGVVQGAAILVNTATAGTQVSASVAVRDANHFVVAWSGNSAVDSAGVLARTIEPANTAPLITTNGGTSTAAVSVAENTTAVTTVGANDADWPSQTVHYSIVGGADQAKFSIDSTSGALRFIDAPDFELPTDAGGDNVYAVTVQASDLLIGTTQAFTITVTDTADQVVANADSATTPYLSPVSIPVLANDQLGTGSTLSLLDITSPAHGKAEVLGGQVVYTPDAGFVGTDTLQYRVIDGSEGLAAYWALDDNVGSLAGEPSPTAGVFGPALQFDGVDDRVGMSGVSYTSEFTLSYWFKLASNSGTGYQYLYAHGTAGTQNSLNAYFIQDATATASGVQNVLRTALIDGNDATATANLAALDIPVTSLLTDNQWHQYTLTTKTGSGSAVYIDGVLRASSSTQGGDAIAPGGAVYLGASNTLSSTRFLTGALDDVALYHRTTPAAAVATMASGPGAIATVTITVTPVNTETPVITSDGGGNVGTPTVAENTTAVTTVTATDADVGGPALTYAIVGGEDQALFRIDSASGVVSFLAAPDAENPADVGRDNAYYVDVQATDGVHADTQTLKIAISDANEFALGPLADADSALDAVDENAAVGTTTGLTARATDADASQNSVTYTLTDTAGGRFAIDAASGVVTVAGLLDAETATAQRITVLATSGDGSSQTQDYVLAVRDLDEFGVDTPTDADAAADTVLESAAVGTAVGVTASATDADAGNNSVRYTLTDDAGGRFAIGSSSGVVTVARTLDAETAGSHEIQVRATSSDGSTATRSITLTVLDVDEFDVDTPTDADATADTVRDIDAIGTAVGITAAARDGDASLNQILYTLSDDAGGRFAIDAVTGAITLARSVVADVGTTQQLAVQATSTDGSVATRNFSVAITQTNLFPPVIGSDGGGDTAALAVPENTAVVTTLVATDADVSPGVLTYTLAGGADQALFTLDAASGVLRFLAPPDAETPRDVGANNQYALVVQVSDGLHTDTQALTITVADVKEFALGAPADVDTTADTVQENAEMGTTVGVRLQASDADATDNAVTYALLDSAGGRFAIDGTTGVLTVAGLLDAETSRVHTVVVQAVSADGSAHALTLNIAVQDVNEFALTPITDGNASSELVREDDPVGTVVGVTAQAQDLDATDSDVSYALLDDAGGRFAIHATTGVVTIARGLDAETALSHTFVVRALSSDGSVQTQAYTLGVQDVDEFDLSTITDTDAAPEVLAENVAIGTPVGLVARAVDADVANNTVTYSLIDSAGGRFAIDASTGVVTVLAALDAETAQGHTLVVRATSSDRSLWTQAFTVAVTDVDEFDLVAISDGNTAADTVAENATVGTSTGLRAQAVDADATTNAVAYALVDDAGGRFAIDASTGVITVATALDAETALSHALVVRATSADGSAWTQAFTVAVTDVDEWDLVTLADADGRADAVLETAVVGTTVGVQGWTVDGDATVNTVTYTLDDSAGGRFAVDAGTGVVTLARSVHEEGVATRGFVLRATSADGSTLAVAFTVAITAVNDAVPVIVSDGGGSTAAITVPEGDTAVTQVRASDADLPAETLRYSVTGGADAVLFTLDAVTGVLRFASAPDAEVPLDQGADNTYEVIVQVSDGLHASAQTVQITVQPLNDNAPVFTSDGGGATVVRHVDENALAITWVQARDADLPADTLTYAVTGGADAALFTLDAATGELRWRTAPDHETPRDADADNVHEVVVSVHDGLHSVSQVLSVVVDNVGEAPQWLANTLTVSEGGTASPVLLARDVDTPAAQLVYTVQDLTGGRFERVAAPGATVARFTQADVDAGAIRFVADGGEAAPFYRLVLADDSTVLAAQAGAVVFTPVNDAPVVSGVDLGVLDEDGRHLITAAALLAGAADVEGNTLTVSSLRLVVGEGTLTDLGDGRWHFDPAADWHGAVALAGAVDDGQASTALAASLQVRAVNDAPHIVSGGGAAALALDHVENTGVVNTVVGADVDADADALLRYAVVGGADAAWFQIDAATGVLSFRQAPDHEQPADTDANNRYEVTVEVSDGALTAQQALQITVTNEDEAPVVTRNVLLLSDGVVTLVLQASDPDTLKSALTYRVDAVEGGQFERAAVPGQAVQVFAQAELDTGEVTWVASAGSTSARYALRLSDGVSEVQVGSPTLERLTSSRTLAELAPVDLLSGNAPSASAADTASSAAAAAASVARSRSAEPAQLAPASAVGDTGLGLGQSAEDGSGAGRSAGTKAADVGAAVSRSAAARAAPAPVAERVEPALDLPSENTESSKRMVAELDLWGSRSGTSLAEQLDRLRQEVAGAQQAGMVSLASTALVSTGLSVGYVIWLVRGGVLMTSLMSVVPAWAGMDPLPVLAEVRRAEGGGGGADDGDDDPIEKLFSKARRLLVRPAAGSADAPELPEIPA